MSTTAETVDQAAPKSRRLLQRQILPIDRDTDVFALYVDPEEPRLDADRYEIGGNRAAKDLNNAAIRQSTSTGRAVHPDQIESRTAFRLRQGEQDVVRHLLQRVPGVVLAALERRGRRAAQRDRRRPRRQRHGVQVDGQRPLPAGGRGHGRG